MYIYNGILLSHRKEGNPAICDNINEPWGHYAKWNQRKTNTIWSQLYVESKTEKQKKSTKLIDTK